MTENQEGARGTALAIAAAPKRHEAFDQFVATIAALRAPDGCPWDREQTHESISHNMVEEAYEAVDAIEAKNASHLREELGDVLLQVVLQSQIAADAGEFTIDDVCADVNAKMIRRHPHVFGDATAADAAETLELWEQVKLAEKNAADKSAQEAGAQTESLLDSVPSSFPALMQAQKISRKAAAAGFEWETLEDVWSKVAEEESELRAAFAAAPKSISGKLDVQGAPARESAGANQGGQASDNAAHTPEELVAAAEMEFGDVLFSLVNVARHMGIDAESALRAACGKFRSRWAHMERAAEASGQRVEDLTNDEREALWEEAKGEDR